MRYRELTTRKIENIEGQLRALRFMVNRAEPIQEFLNTIEHTEGILAEVKSLIQQEPLSQDEGFGLQ
jgi:DNA-binding FrmR family transcriptional regulator